MKFGRLVHAEWHADCGDTAEIEQEVEFQYCGRLFFKTGNSYVSAVRWAITMKYGLLISRTFSDVTKSETGSKIVTQRPPSWKSV